MLKIEDLKEKTYIIAEMSANHAGKLENALEIVRAVKESGADCLKIQTYTADTITLNCDTDYFRIKHGLWKGYTLYDLYKEAYTPWEWQPIIKQECERIGLDFLSTPFDKTAVDFLNEMNCEAFKIASYELVDIPLIKYTATKGKTMIISCGMGTVEEIQDAINACEEVGNRNIILLKCCSEYPANYNDMNLSVIQDMRKRFSYPIGLSDHSPGYIADVIAVSLGAKVIEKHVCLNRNIKNPDSEFSMEIPEFKEMIEKIRLTEKILGKETYELSVSEREGKMGRRSLFATKEIRKGECFTENNVRSVRPSDGISPKYYETILNKEAKYSYGEGEPIRKEEIELC